MTTKYYSVDGLLLSGGNISANNYPDIKSANDFAKLLINGDASKAATINPDGKGGYNVFYVEIANAKPFTNEKGYSTVFYGQPAE